MDTRFYARSQDYSPKETISRKGIGTDKAIRREYAAAEGDKEVRSPTFDM